jgi:YfiH family protein
LFTLFTDRFGGVSAPPYDYLNFGDHVGDIPDHVAANRASLIARVGSTLFMNQVHGDKFHVVQSADEPIPTCDALITTTSAINLAVQVADCIPLLIHGDSVVAAVHVGRKGLVNDIAVKVLDEMKRLGGKNFSAWIGPHICGNCYEVSQDVYDEVISKYPTSRSQTTKGTHALDLARPLRENLEEHGVRVNESDICTVESLDHFSYRRDGITGRTVGVIAL